MANDLSDLTGVEKKTLEMIKALGECLTDKVLVVVDRANVAPAPTAAIWSYTVPFHLEGEVSGLVIPLTGTIGAAAGDTSTAGTAAVDSATPTVTMGRGTVVLSGDAAAWLDTETATLTLTYTNLRGGTDTDTFVVTFTA